MLGHTLVADFKRKTDQTVRNVFDTFNRLIKTCRLLLFYTTDIVFDHEKQTARNFTYSIAPTLHLRELLGIANP